MSISLDSIITECSHCGNNTPHTKIFEYTKNMLFEQAEDDVYFEDYTWFLYKCGTCGGLNMYGDFFRVYQLNMNNLLDAKLYPKGSGLLPPSHMISPSDPIPSHILKLYEEVWPLRHRSPSAFIGQIRRLLEYICVDQKASGKDLYGKLQDLITKGILPGYFGDITDLLRVVGNLGAHASDKTLDIWDAELIDEFFRFVIEYVYVAPAKIKRMKERMRT